MARFCVLALLIRQLDCARIELLDSSNDGRLGAVSSDPWISVSSTDPFRHEHRYRLKNMLTGRFLSVRAGHEQNGDSLFTVSERHAGNVWVANTERFCGLMCLESEGHWASITLTNQRSGNNLHVGMQLTRAGSRVQHVHSDSEGSRWQVEHVGENRATTNPIVMLQSLRSGDFLNVDDFNHEVEDPVTHGRYHHRALGARRESVEWEVVELPGRGEARYHPPIRARGSWVFRGTLAATGTYELILSAGSTMTNTHEVSSTFTTEVSATVSGGFECEGAEVGGSVTQTVGQQLTTRAEFSTSQNQAETHRITVNITHRNHHRWQWTFVYTQAGEVKGETRTTHYALTAGSLQKPACLPGYHTDAFEGAQNCEAERFRIKYRDQI